MPITGPSSYVSTIEEFEQHWLSADTALGPGNEIVLPNGTNRAGLIALKNALIAKRSDLQARLNDKEVARGDMELKKAALLDRLVQFNDKIRAFFPGSKWVPALPNVPGPAEAQSKITDPLEDAANLWLQINADPLTAAPVTLLGGYTQAAFAADIAALKAAYATLNAAETKLKVTREERNDIQDEIYAVLKSYRQVLPTFFAKTHALVESLPRLTPLPGATPAAVTAEAVWDATLEQARITWTASSDPDLFQYEVRFSPGPVYSTDDETVIGNIPPGGPLELLTAAGLDSPGSVAGYRVYVMLTTGNENGSNTVVVTRPLAGPGP